MRSPGTVQQKIESSDCSIDDVNLSLLLSLLLRLYKSSLLLRHKEEIEDLAKNHILSITWYISKRIEGRGGNWQDAEELAQDVFVKLLDNIHRYDPSKSTLKTWLYRLAAFRVMDFKRKIITEPIQLQFTDEIEENLKDESAEERFSQIDEKQKRRLLKKALKRLPEADVQLITWHHLEGMTVDEIADRLNLSVGTVKSKLYRARYRLKLLMLV